MLGLQACTALTDLLHEWQGIKLRSTCLQSRCSYPLSHVLVLDQKFLQYLWYLDLIKKLFFWGGGKVHCYNSWFSRYPAIKKDLFEWGSFFPAFWTSVAVSLTAHLLFLSKEWHVEMTVLWLLFSSNVSVDSTAGQNLTGLCLLWLLRYEEPRM